MCSSDLSVLSGSSKSGIAIASSLSRMLSLIHILRITQRSINHRFHKFKFFRIIYRMIIASCLQTGPEEMCIRDRIYTALTRARKKLILLIQDNISWLIEFTKLQMSVLAKRNSNLFSTSVREDISNICLLYTSRCV